ncbi:MAG: protein-disulfide reductase DsbD family protein, partial [Gammaproteobacteria bacterium]|nr:protein-disulfide reductase DsbD family protein [Gammaproteobacteria bacterium]
GNEDYQIASLDMPKGKMILDKVFGNKESYEGAVDVNIALKTINDSGKVIVTTSYQGCSEKGLCYPPQTVQTEINLSGS